jgi:sugar lactone lactonase YvrE
MTPHVFDDRQCVLGEGPLWHPIRKELFWFDILAKKLLTKDREWLFDEYVSAAGWIDADRLLVASEKALFTLDLNSDERVHVVDLDAENEVTRSNDGRADPQGGFWIGTMGKQAEPKVGAIYRYYRSEVRKLFDEISISNSICFSQDGKMAFYTDTPTRQIMRVGLDVDGWPLGQAEVFVDLNSEKVNPDGSVVDADGCLWNAQWGASRVAKYGPDGTFLEEISIPAAQTTCPAFGGEDMQMLFITSAKFGLKGADDGMTFAVDMSVRGQAEHQVIL